MKAKILKQKLTILSYQLSILLALLSIFELLSFAAISSRRGLFETLKFHPVITAIESKFRSFTFKSARITTLGSFSPLVQDRFQPNTSYGPLEINECGYISNQRFEENCLTKLYSKDSFKIFLIGGSSMAGSGVDNNEDTISGIIQTTLSDEYPTKDFLVFNFGAGGSYTFRQASLVLSELLNYEPDIILSFDGFNDAFYWHLEPLRGDKILKDNKPIPNWADYSYQNYLKNTGLETPKTGQIFLTYSIELMRSLGQKINPIDRWQYSSEYKLTRRIKNSPEVAAIFFYRNVSSMVLNTVNSSEDSCFIEVLQGDSHHNVNRTTSDEFNLRQWHKRYSSKFGDAYTYENYKSHMSPLYTAYSNILNDDPYNLKINFKSKYSWYDLRHVFTTRGSSLSYYVDNIHTNRNGNEVLSASFLDFIKRTSCFEKYID